MYAKYSVREVKCTRITPYANSIDIFFFLFLYATYFVRFFQCANYTSAYSLSAKSTDPSLTVI